MTWSETISFSFQLKEIENRVKKIIAEVAEFATTEVLPSEEELFTDIFK